MLEEFEGDLAILQLLAIIWNDIASDISIKFEHRNGTRQYMPCLNTKNSDLLDVKCEEVTDILHELGKKDCLSLKGTRCLLQQVYVDPSGIQGTIRYRQTGSGANVCREFQLLEDTRTYELVPLPSPLSLLDLPTEIIIDIAEFALTNHEATYNFDTWHHAWT
jgi:hypothetical protein